MHRAETEVETQRFVDKDECLWTRDEDVAPSVIGKTLNRPQLLRNGSAGYEP